MNEKEKTIEVYLNEYQKAPDGSLLIKKNNVWQTTTFDELAKKHANKLNKIDALKNEIDDVKKYQKHFKIYAKSHFLVVFNLFLTKVYNGDIDCDDDEILTLDEKVIQGEISVKDAIEKHEYLKTTFESVFNDKETIEFPEV